MLLFYNVSNLSLEKQRRKEKEEGRKRLLY